ncbi:MAG: NAD(P)-dependent oxidoreductase [Lachnospiraceae bacterium]|nr:NAD(P)-dependent oxidoreductase [Lachnospiraceae bacterium]
MLIAVTGTSGSIGSAAVPKLLENKENICRLLFRKTPVNLKIIQRLQKQYGDQVQITFGDITDSSSCRTLVQGADFVLHMAALIPPKADHDDALTWKTNYEGTVNLTDAIIQEGNTAALIFISTVAVYGHRCYPHYFGRTGDPLMPSVFDGYGASKVRAERYILESELNQYVILRETGVLYDNLMMKNIHDGLMFQTPVNAFIEWVTANDTARLFDRIIAEGNSKEGFWNRVYNIGGGIECRQTGFETYDDGFKLIGGSAKKIFEPRWHNQRNFHCFWYSDSQILEDLFHFRHDTCASFWKEFSDHHKIYRMGKLLPAGLLKAMVIKPLLKSNNAPNYWVKNHITAKITATYGGMEQYKKIPKTWEQTDLFCEHADYEQMKIHDPEKDLSHGYDETKPDNALSLEDMKEAALFRGGEVLSEEMQTGDLRTKLKWKCHNGHEFESSPYTVLKAGHWCPHCCEPKDRWEYDELSRHIPFFAQAWYDSHGKEENYVYTLDENGEPHVSLFAEREEIHAAHPDFIGHK